MMQAVDGRFPFIQDVFQSLSADGCRLVEAVVNCIANTPLDFADKHYLALKSGVRILEQLCRRWQLRV